VGHPDGDAQHAWLLVARGWGDLVGVSSVGGGVRRHRSSSTRPFGLRPGLVFVEGLEVHSGRLGELFHLALADRHPAVARDCLLGLLEGPTGRLDGRQLTKSVGVALVGQVQRGIGGVEVLLCPVAVGEMAGRDRADDRGEGMFIFRLDCTVAGPASIKHFLEPYLLGRPQVEVVLKEQAEQLEARGLDVLLQLDVFEDGGRPTDQEVADPAELGCRGTERLARGVSSRRLGRSAQLGPAPLPKTRGPLGEAGVAPRL